MNSRPSTARYIDPDEPEALPRTLPTYLGITGLLMVLVVVLAGGIIWYNSAKSSALALAAARQLMEETEQKVVDRVRLLYDPMFAIVGVSSLVPEFTTPTSKDDPATTSLLLRVLHVYPQILSLYVGFDTGQFAMVTHLAGDEEAALRQVLHAPPEAAFATETVATDTAGKRMASWAFRDDSGNVIGTRPPEPSSFDPRERPWYRPAKQSDVVEHSELYIFASNGQPGFTLSRGFDGPTPGVIGADLATADLVSFLREQKITPGTDVFIFTRSGELVASSNKNDAPPPVKADDAGKTVLPKIADMHDPVIGGFVAAYQNEKMAGSRVYEAAGRTYIARVADIPPRYGRDQLLATLVPIDEIEQPIIDVRNQTLLYSIAFLILALPLYATLIVAWIDRRLQRPRA